MTLVSFYQLIYVQFFQQLYIPEIMCLTALSLSAPGICLIYCSRVTFKCYFEPCWPTGPMVWKHDVIHRTKSTPYITQHNAVRDNMHKKFGEVRQCSFWVIYSSLFTKLVSRYIMNLNKFFKKQWKLKQKNLTKYYNFLQNLHKNSFTAEWYRII